VSRTLARWVAGFARLITAPTSARQRARTYARIKAHFDRAAVHDVPTRNGPLRFYLNTGAAAASAVHTFMENEPETIAWLDDWVKPGDIVWDVGANVGLYACYAAKAGARVLAFEPSGLNFGLLVAHVELNGLGDLIAPYCLALGRRTEATELFMSAFEPGHAFSSIDRPESQVAAFEPAFRQAILAFTADDLVGHFALPSPDHLKIDVDGTEIEILEGAEGVLRGVRTVIMEVEGKNAARFEGEILPLMKRAGLKPSMAEEASPRNRLFVRA
jgi:FkbM family methyltransferase